MKHPEYIVIRVKRPEDYDDVCAELVAEDFLATYDGGNWQYEVVDSTGTEWIAVDDKLPPYNRKIGSLSVEVLIWPAMESGERTAFFGRRISRKPTFYRYGAPVHGVTHWMPLPTEPPRARAQLTMSDESARRSRACLGGYRDGLVRRSRSQC
ncbi:DUF551 domain-containing protein [Burkholderia cenocepacia]|uniref:DUF551 domain-containing protein n=1 Tax=Burkholderia cenocepacia TaxID=95486 RepID=UPI000D69C054|nr:DUF551 domain-containing protein [Burkholderia cenocepacia]MDN7545062.1 DUF551 domain-containing protein [Burkholderia cenocepacia]